MDSISDILASKTAVWDYKTGQIFISRFQCRRRVQTVHYLLIMRFDRSHHRNVITHEFWRSLYLCSPGDIYRKLQPTQIGVLMDIYSRRKESIQRRKMELLRR